MLKLSFTLRTDFPSLVMAALVQKNLKLWNSFDSFPLDIFREIGCGQVGVFFSRDTFHLNRLLRASFNLALNTARMGVHNFCTQSVPVPHHPHSKEFLPNT